MEISEKVAPSATSGQEVANIGSDSDLEVVVDGGVLRGRHVFPTTGTPLVEFWGVPYAAPPVGSLRLQRPRPPAPWQGTRDAGTRGAACPQVTTYGPQKGQFLLRSFFLPPTRRQHQRRGRLFVPEHLHLQRDLLDPETGDGLDPWRRLHSGGHSCSTGVTGVLGQGAGHDYHPRRMVEEGVLVVTINYRLGGLGFLTFGTPRYGPPDDIRQAPSYSVH